VYALPQKLGHHAKKKIVLMSGEDGCCWPRKSVKKCLKKSRVNGDRSEKKYESQNAELTFEAQTVSILK
jgi:hypothetical protein